MDETAEICWMNQKPAPEIIEELTSCWYKKSKCQNKKCANVKLKNSCVQTFVVVLNVKTMVQEKMINKR